MIKKITKNLIYTILNSRLKTHDRRVLVNESYFYFQPKLYSTLYNDFNRSYFNEITDIEINKVKIFYLNSNVVEFCLFQSIDCLKIDLSNNQLYLQLKDIEYKLLTPINQKQQTISDYEIFILETKEFSKATIDHNPTFQKFINENISQLPTLHNISSYINSNNLAKLSAKERELVKNYIVSNNLSDKLWEELIFLAENQNLELVHSKFNHR